MSIVDGMAWEREFGTNSLKEMVVVEKSIMDKKNEQLTKVLLENAVLRYELQIAEKRLEILLENNTGCPSDVGLVDTDCFNSGDTEHCKECWRNALKGVK